jgi:hypothetical protein
MKSYVKKTNNWLFIIYNVVNLFNKL